MIAQLLVVYLLIIGMVVNIFRHGEKTNLKYNAWNELLNVITLAYLLYLGSFWDCFFAYN